MKNKYATYTWQGRISFNSLAECKKVAKKEHSKGEYHPIFKFCDKDGYFKDFAYIDKHGRYREE